MDSPLKHHFDPAERPDCLDVSPERLNPMTAAQLERELEAALEAMTEAEYDPAVIDAYLDALDRKAPMPDHPDAGTAYAGFQARVQRAAGQVSGRRASRRSRVRLRTLLRVAAAAALLTTFLFSSMVVAQAWMCSAPSPAGRTARSASARCPGRMRPALSRPPPRRRRTVKQTGGMSRKNITKYITS